MPEIAYSIHRIDHISGANCYVIINESRIIVVDTGMPGNAKRIINYIKGLGETLSDTDIVILTHADIDHIGSASDLKKLAGVKIAIHAEDAPMLSGKRGLKTIKGPLGVIFKLMAQLIRLHFVEPDILLEDQSEVDGLQVIHTPGHTRGSISLYQQGKVILVGDALRSDSRGNLRFPSKSLTLDPVQAKNSFIAISRLDFDVLLPGHGAPVMGKASVKLKEVLNHMK